jgi:hypothetical protein
MVALAAANGGKAHVFNTTRRGCYIEREIRDDLVFAAKVDDARLDVWCILLRPSLYAIGYTDPIIDN